MATRKPKKEAVEVFRCERDLFVAVSTGEYAPNGMYVRLDALTQAETENKKLRKEISDLNKILVGTVK